MTSIIIYIRSEVLKHKKGFVQDDDWSITGDYSWVLERCFPKRVELGDKIYFAVKGFILGYFVIKEITYPDIIFFCESWQDLQKPIPTKSFQGFKYADKVKELLN